MTALRRLAFGLLVVGALTSAAMAYALLRAARRAEP